MAANFKFSEVPGGVLVSGALNVSKWSLVGSNVTMNIEWYLNFIASSV